MAILTEDMRRVLDEQQLGFIATVDPDGSPNLSPKGTTAAFDEEHLAFVDIRSPNTVRNLEANPAVEINVVDATLRKGYRFKGSATVLAEGPQFETLVKFFRARGSQSPIRHVVLIKVDKASALTSPAYDQGRTEAEITTRWDRHWDDLRRRRAQR